MEREQIALWAPLLSGAVVVSCLIYCTSWWEPQPMTWKDPDCSLLCWLYCAQLKTHWAAAGLTFSGLSILAGPLHRRARTFSSWLNALAGIPLFPTGALNFLAVWAIREYDTGQA